VAGTNPLATDMVAANIMGFEPPQIPTFTWANKAGLRPAQIDEIEVRGEPVEKVARQFARPQIAPWEFVRNFWATREI